MASDFHTHTLGCKVNFSDTQLFAETVKSNNEDAVAVVGTCCVTAEGERQSRKAVRRAIKKVGSNGKVYVTGCAAKLNPLEFDKIAENVEVVTDWSQREKNVNSSAVAALAAAQSVSKGTARTIQRSRFFLKVQDGCGRKCTYCIIPIVRGRPVSIPLMDVLSLAKNKINEGFKEIVITGINVGAYSDGKVGIAGLMERLARLTGLKRLRLSSIEAPHIDNELLEVIKGNNVIGRHLHVPLQSGDDALLKHMGRSYALNLYLQKVKMARQAIPGINLTTDVIVGFPAEDINSFKNTLRIVEEVGFTKIHVFPFSPRPGTIAFLMNDQVAQPEKKRRARALRELSDKLGLRHRQKKVGLVEEILLENALGNGNYRGYSSDYTRYDVKGGKENSLVAARGIKATANSVSAELICSAVV